MPRISVSQAGGQNRCAFLDTIATSEIGAVLLAQTDDGYNVLVGATPSNPLTFSNYARHPDILNTHVGSTAAGRYQILFRYWQIYQQRLNLPDFGPVSQDLYALEQLRERHALPLIDAGDFAGAIAAVNNIWASLPGSPYGQHTNALDDLQTAYQQAGGIVSA